MSLGLNLALTKFCFFKKSSRVSGQKKRQESFFLQAIWVNQLVTREKQLNYSCIFLINLSSQVTTVTACTMQIYFFMSCFDSRFFLHIVKKKHKKCFPCSKWNRELKTHMLLKYISFAPLLLIPRSFNEQQFAHSVGHIKPKLQQLSLTLHYIFLSHPEAREINWFL